MKIGMKLDADFDRHPAYRELYGTADVPGRLRALGVEAVEIPLGSESDHEHIVAQARRCRAAGLQVSFHPYSERSAANPAHFTGPSSAPAALHARLLTMAAVMAAEQGDTVVNVHPAAVADDGAGRPTLVERSVRFFAWARRWCDEHAPRVRPVAELQIAPDPGERLVRIGDTPSELAEVVTRSGVGACWDVGHAVSNHRRFGTAADPPDRLLRQITHVHCHDVDETDHRPPRRGAAPWRRFLQRLAATGYTATVIIEVTPPTFLAAGALGAVEEALATVRDATDAPPVDGTGQ
jgi:sugar phosphate isomerase/epimerase